MTQKRVRWIAGASALVVVIGITGWLGWSHRIADDVVVSWADRPTCTGTTIKINPVEQTHGNDATVDDVGDLTPVIQAEAGMHCSVAVVVENRSNRTIHIDRVAAAWLGPGSVAPIVSPPRVPYDAVRTDPEDDSDILVNVDEPLRPGDKVGIKVSFDAQPTCMEAGGVVTYGNWPAVDISALGRRHRIHAAEDLKVKVTRSTSSSHC